MALLPASIPTVTQPVASQTYDGWFLYDLHTSSGDPNNVQGVAVLRKSRQNPDGTIEYSPLGEMVTVSLGNITQNPDPNVQAAVQAVMMAIVSQAKVQGIQL